MKRRKPSRLAIIDHLTGLYNRRYFDKRLKKIISEAKKKEKKHFSLLMIDIDKFKDVNDKYGHLEGDKVLNNLSQVLKKSVRKPDICFRYGGDEIAVLLPNADRKTSRNIAVRLKNKVEKHKFSIEGGQKLRLKLSLGLATFPEDGLETKALIKQADVLLYKAKARKKPKIGVKDPFILETKLIPPVLKENVIARPKLVSSLKINLNKKLILITADAGYGKTTLLLQLLKEEKLPHVFYTLDDSDSELTTFISHLAFGLEKVQKGLCERTKNLISQIQNPAGNDEMMVGTLINELLEKRKEELLIILDDYHNIQKNTILHNAMNYFIEHLPRKIRVIISSRAVLPLDSIPRWRSKQYLFELTRKQLRFTEEEIENLFTEIYQSTFHKEETKRLIEHTEGWATGIQLVLQAARTDGRAIRETLNGYLESNRPLFEYFANEIFRSEPSEIQTFLLKVSLLDELTPDVCNVLTERKDSVVLLEQLVQRNLFTMEIEPLSKTYLFHRLFKQFLEKKLLDEHNHEGVRKLQHKAARYFENRKIYNRAIDYYLLSLDHKEASKLLQIIAEDFIKKGRFDTVNRWMDALPDELLNKRPWLMFCKADILRYLGRWDEALEVFNRARKNFELSNDIKGICKSLQRVGYVLSFRGDYKSTIKIAREALNLLKERDKAIKIELLNIMAAALFYTGHYLKAKNVWEQTVALASELQDTTLQARVTHNLGLLHNELGDFNKAIDTYHSSLNIDNSGYNVAVVLNNLGHTYITIGSYKEAESTLHEALQNSQKFKNKRIQAFVELNLGDLCLQLENNKSAFEYYEKSISTNSDLKQDFLTSLAYEGISKIYLAQKKYHKAEEYINKVFACVKQKNEYGSFLITGGIIKLESCRLLAAEKIFLEAMNIIKKVRRKYDLMRIHYYLARLYLKKKKGQGFQRSQDHIKRALKIAKKNGYDFFLINEWHQDADILNFAFRNMIELNYLAHIYSKIGPRAVDFLISFLKEKNHNNIRRLAIESIGKTDDRRIVTPLQEHLKKEKDSSVRQSLMQSLRFLNRELVIQFRDYDMVIHFFGDVQVFIGDMKLEVNHWNTQKSKGIFCYLMANRDKKITKEKLIELFWPDKGISQGRSSLKFALHSLRENLDLLGDMKYTFILYQRPYYFINPSYHYWIDVEKLLELVRDGDLLSGKHKKHAIEKYENAIKIHQGHYLDEFYYPWVEAQRNYFKGFRLKVLKKTVDYYFENSDYEKCIAICKQILIEDELDKGIHLILLTAYMKIGANKEAIRCYQEITEMLRRKFNREPSIEVKKLYQELI